MRSVFARLLPAAVLCACACGSGKQPKPGDRVRDTPAAAAPSEPPAPLEQRGDQFDLVSNVARCEVDHFGKLIDLGTTAAAIWQSFQAKPPSSDENVTRDGATLLRTTSREQSYDFWLPERAETLDISLRARGLVSKWLYVDIDQHRAASLRLNEDELKVTALPTFKEPLDAGRHRIRLRFSGASRNTRVPLAEVDWIRLGGKDNPASSYAAPTLTDVVSDVALSATPRRSFVLRGGSTLRCFLRPARDAKLQVALGFWGAGTGVGAISVVRDGAPAVTLQTRKLNGGDAATWTPLELDLGEYASEVIGLELSALDATRGGRVAFGDPVIVRKPEPLPAPPLARTVVMIVLGSVQRAELPPWGATGSMTALGEIARGAVAFSQYRAPSSVVQSVLGTLLTGLPPRAHRLEEASDRLPASVRSVQRIVKEASGRTAMFTSVPTSFAPFGFDVGWDVYESFSPVNDVAATEPFMRAARWLEKELDDDASGRRFVLIHARGAHPPWDISREDAQQLKPQDYSGAIDPRRGGIVIGALRNRTRRNVRRLTDDDWVRLKALSEAALAKQDQGVARLIAALKSKNAWDSALVVVMGDAAPVAAPELPFDPVGVLTEDRLAVPLLVKFPGSVLAGSDVSVGSSAADLPVTVLSAFGLRAPEGFTGLDLFYRANGRSELSGDAQVATLPGRYATRIGSWLLRGALGQVPALCALDVDPACSRDVLNEHTVAARATWIATYSVETESLASAGRVQRAPATLDKDTAAALAVWGDIPP